VPESMTFLLSGALLGMAAGITPGPLLTLVISETLKHSRKEGIIIASAPVLTDVPIILLSVFILKKLSGFNFILGSISILGAFFIAYLAYESFTIKSIELNLQNNKIQSLGKGIITNISSPHPYLFWMTVGAPAILKAFRINPMSGLLFILGFYLFLVGSKIIAALIVDKSKSFLQSNTYIYIIRTSGFVLLVFSILFIRDGLKLFGII
jgi:threonine/homoserine/homoserine lactone efflux protein